MKMRVKSAIFVTFVLFLFLPLAQWTKPAKAETEKPKIIFKMATNAPWGLELTDYLNKEVSIALKGKTDGKAAFSWYHGGVMGDNRDYIAKMHIDQLQGCILDASGIEIAVPEAGAMQLPFLFNDIDEVRYVMENMRQYLITHFKKKGYRVLFFLIQPFDDVYSKKYEGRALEDFKKIKIGMYCGVVQQETINALGASLIPMNVPEIVPSMRTGICDGLILPAAWYVGSQLYTITRYATPSTMRIPLAALVVTTKAWNRIPQEYHEAVDKEMCRLGPGLTSIINSNNARCYRAMIAYGMKEVTLTPDDIEVWKKRTRPVWGKLAGKAYPREFLDEVLGHLQEYRSIAEE